VSALAPPDPPADGYDARTALIVVDMQNDFADPRGSLYVRGGEDVVPVVNREVAAAVAAGGLVVFTQDWHPPETPHFDTHGGPWPVHCVRDTWGAELHPGVHAAGERIRKAQGDEDGYSGFSVQQLRTGRRVSTGLDQLLRARGIVRVVIVGLATDYCVKATALDAVGAGFETTVRRAGIRAVDVEAGDGDRAIDALVAAGVTVA
jgi:nicotinamidase/pyrazinamidase